MLQIAGICQEAAENQYSKRNAKKYRDEEKLRNKKVNDLQARAENNPHNRHIILELQRARSRLKKIMLTKTKGAILRSKVSWHEEGERNTKNFYSLEKCHRDVKTVSKLKVGENCYIEDQFEILEEEKKFYESLYRSTNIDPKNFKNSPFFNPENVTALSEEEKKSCEMGSRTSTIIKPRALMVCQLNSTDSFGQTSVMIC